MSDLLLGTISSVNTEGVTIVVDGETTPTSKRYSFIQGYYPTVNDRVVIAEVGDQYVVIGKLQTQRLQSGARFVNDYSLERNIYFSTFNNGWWMGYADREGGSITWKQLTVAS